MGLIGTPQLLSSESSIDDQYFRTYVRTYLVYATTDADENYVRSNLGIGIYGTHPTDSHALVNRISVKQASPNIGFYDSIANPGLAGSPPTNGTACFQWLAEVNWGPWSPIQSTSSGNPTDQPLEITMNGVNYEKIVDVDVSGNPVVNTAGDYFDPPVVKDQVRCTIEVTRNETGFTPSTVFAYANMLNLATWNGFPAKSIKIAPPRVVPMYSQFSNELYSRITYTFEYDPDGWQKKILNQGYRQLKTISGTAYQFNIRDKNGDVITSPALLDSSGVELVQPITSSNVVVLPFDIYPTLDFTVLSLDSIFTY